MCARIIFLDTASEAASAALHGGDIVHGEEWIVGKDEKAADDGAHW